LLLWLLSLLWLLAALSHLQSRVSFALASPAVLLTLIVTSHIICLMITAAAAAAADLGQQRHVHGL
jgi:hypothetical protein